jgi:hypothetical protein
VTVADCVTTRVTAKYVTRWQEKRFGACVIWQGGKTAESRKAQLRETAFI